MPPQYIKHSRIHASRFTFHVSRLIESSLCPHPLLPPTLSHPHLVALGGSGHAGGGQYAQPALSDVCCWRRGWWIWPWRWREARQGAERPTRRRSWGAFLRLGLIIATFAALFNWLAAHIGTHVLIRLPGDWPLIGGPLTLEGLVYGLLNGLALITLLAVFGTFNAGADTYALLRAIPAGFAQAGLVTAIALAYMPQTLTRWAEIREAQTLRGHRLRGVRDLVPLAVPLLTGGLDRAINLAEAMEARGFAPEGTATSAPRRLGAGRIRLLLGGGVVAVLIGGFLSAYFRQQPAGAGQCWRWAGEWSSAALVALGRRSARTRYRRETLAAARSGWSALALLGRGAHPGRCSPAPPPPGATTPIAGLAWPAFQPGWGLVAAGPGRAALPFVSTAE